VTAAVVRAFVGMRSINLDVTKKSTA
jgi:hypothetical protein